MKLVKSVNGNTKIVGVLGNPLENSILPMVHNTITYMLGFNLIYIPFCIKENKLGEAILGLRSLDVLGFDITTPYKKEVMKYIDDNMRLSFFMGQINTVKNIEGRLYGYNTYGEGFARAAKDYDLFFKNKIITILGSSEDARSIAVKLSNSKVSKINIVDKNIENAKSIKSTINDNIEEIVDVYTYKDKQFFNVCQESDVLINATFAGKLSKADKNVIYTEKIFKKNQFVYDIINDPNDTFFLDIAKEKGCKTINKLGMFFYQCILSYEIWTGYKFTKNEMEKIYSLLR